MMDSISENGTESLRSPPLPRKRRTIACERCHRRRVRCDASVNGMPCSECRKSNTKTCRLVQSKRTRGADGRYVFPDQKEAQSSSPSTTDGVDGLAAVGVERAEHHAMMMKSQKDPEMPVNLARLVGAEHDGSFGDEPTSRGETISPKATDGDSPQQDGRANFVGESWYASYVLSTSVGAGHMELHRPIEHGRSKTSPTSPDDGDVESMTQTTPRRLPPADLPSQSLTERLLEAYFQRFHVFCPILDRSEFLESVRDGSVPITLLRSVLFVASIHCSPEIFHLMGYSTRLDAGDDLFSKACASFDADHESDRTTMVLSSYLLHYYFGRPTSYRDTLWWLGNAIRSAQCMGYHRSTKNSKMPEKQKARWKRIWWLLYIRDRQVCLSTGPPMSINDLDCDVEDLTMEDLQDETPETAQYIIGQISLNKTASNMFYCHCSPSRLPLSRDASVRQVVRREIQTAMEEWYAHADILKNFGEYHHLTLTLKVCYHYYIINLQQRLQRLCHKPFADSEGSKVILEAAKQVSTLVQDSLLYWSPEDFPLIYISAIFTAMMAHVADCGITGENRLQLPQKLRPSLLALKQFEQCYVLARWIRNLFMDIINRPNKPRRRCHRFDQTPSIGSQMISSEQQIHTEDQSQTQFQTMDRLEISTENPYSVHDPDSASHLSTGNASSYMYDSSTYDNPPLGSETATSPGGTRTYVPNFMTNEFLADQFGGTDGLDMIEFPSPTSFEYQHLHFLADLGLSSFTNSK